jgi:cyclopropane fatty-acyl-phospholipid synthase-like methyltransferase
MKSRPSYHAIIEHYEECFRRFGDTHRGVDWPHSADAQRRYQVMLEAARPFPLKSPCSLLDFGCGAAHLYDYVRRHQLSQFRYSGLDASQTFIDLCRRKHPHIQFYHRDILADRQKWPSFDLIVMNGVFTEKRELSYSRMFAYFQATIKRAFPHARKALAFNIMSKHVDWERRDLFHVPFDPMARFLTGSLTRNFIFRNDYGLFEYTVYVYR